MTADAAPRSRWGFFLYDFASSGYVLIVGTFLFPLFLRERALADHPRPDLVWGTTLSAAVIGAALLAPLLGYLADRSDHRRVLAAAVGVTALGCASLAWLAGSPAPSATALLAAFVVTHAGYLLSVALCDSYLPLLGEGRERAGVSTFGWGFGYLGGVVCLLGVLAIGGAQAGHAGRGMAWTALFYAGLSVLALRLLPSRRRASARPLWVAARAVIDRRLVGTLVAFWLINEGIVTVLFFTALFGRETLSLEPRTIGAVFVAVQLLAFPATWAVGRLARRLGTVPVIVGSVGLWCALLVALALASSAIHFVATALVSSLVIGSTQALMRAHYSHLYPRQASGLSFGLYTLVSKSASLIGPAAFGLIAAWSGSQRPALLATSVPFVAGGVLLSWLSRRGERLS